MCTQKMRALSYIRAEKITFLPKPDIIHTYRRTDISVYRVASLLKKILATKRFNRPCSFVFFFEMIDVECVSTSNKLELDKFMLFNDNKRKENQEKHL